MTAYIPPSQYVEDLYNDYIRLKSSRRQPIGDEKDFYTFLFSKMKSLYERKTTNVRYWKKREQEYASNNGTALLLENGDIVNVYDIVAEMNEKHLLKAKYPDSEPSVIALTQFVNQTNNFSSFKSYKDVLDYCIKMLNDVYESDNYEENAKKYGVEEKLMRDMTNRFFKG